MLADYIYDGIISLYNLALERFFNIATLNIMQLKKFKFFFFLNIKKKFKKKKNK